MSISRGPSHIRPAQTKHHEHEQRALTSGPPRASIMSISRGPSHITPAQTKHHEHQPRALSHQARRDQASWASATGPLASGPRRPSIMNISRGPSHIRPAQGKHHEHQPRALSHQARSDQASWASAAGPLTSGPPRPSIMSISRGLSHIRPAQTKHHGHQPPALSHQARPGQASWASAAGPLASGPPQAKHHEHQPRALSHQARPDQASWASAAGPLTSGPPRPSIMGISRGPSRIRPAPGQASRGTPCQVVPGHFVTTSPKPLSPN